MSYWLVLLWLILIYPNPDMAAMTQQPLVAMEALSNSEINCRSSIFVLRQRAPSCHVDNLVKGTRTGKPRCCTNMPSFSPTERLSSRLSDLDPSKSPDDWIHVDDKTHFTIICPLWLFRLSWLADGYTEVLVYPTPWASYGPSRTLPETTEPHAMPEQTSRWLSKYISDVTMTQSDEDHWKQSRHYFIAFLVKLFKLSKYDFGMC